MPKRDPDLLIEDMLAAIRKVERYTSEMDQGLFSQDEKTIDAVVRTWRSWGRQHGSYRRNSSFGTPMCHGDKSPVCATVSCMATSVWTSRSSGRSFAMTCRSSKQAWEN